MDLAAKGMFMLFPTPLFTGKLSDLSACDRIEAKLRAMQKAAGNAGAPAYMTPDNIRTLPEMNELVDVIMRESGQILDAHKIKRDSHYITNMWANINEPNHRHLVHVHPNCLFCGILYIKTPKDCAPTIFNSPRQMNRMLEPPIVARNELNADTFVMRAEKGRILLWPSYLPHGVDHGHSTENEERIVLAFNIMIRGLVKMETMRLQLA
jgi:uncharacterized protein (TIGR02466 family)